ncbi:MAG TPA: SHOCT domain-containing protein [Candidatus Lachnoclostridium pullistercoris]|uniref:SHOCT domain-containing protein n=1 Tax=Candidatus Lachnoclostridium pullistercoris TaxID=2838632 RepID=A0A9D2PB99_9FIRM|nr:SHOCT domain-containing protein [Candidatus Lachnoclostridium pullistercoris]
MSKKIRVKPGKAQSAVGLVTGLIFCLIGVTIVIPSAGLFGVFWTAIAAVITITNGINALSDKGVSSHEIIIENEERQESKSEHSETETLEKDIRERLDAAKALYEAGTITGEEYEAKRKEILKRL